MFELEEARRQNKTVITLVVEPGFFPRKQGGVQVVGSGWADETLKRLCEVSTTLFAGDEEDDNKVPVGLATLAAKYDWKGKTVVCCYMHAVVLQYVECRPLYLFLLCRHSNRVHVGRTQRQDASIAEAATRCRVLPLTSAA